MRIGRRPLFFSSLAVISLLLWEPTPPEYRWVNLFAAGLAAFWAVLLFLEDRSLLRWSPRSDGRRGSDEDDDRGSR